MLSILSAYYINLTDQIITPCSPHNGKIIQWKKTKQNKTEQNIGQDKKIRNLQRDIHLLFLYVSP